MQQDWPKNIFKVLHEVLPTISLALMKFCIELKLEIVFAEITYFLLSF